MAAKILVVEDNEDSRLILLLMLKHFGYEAIGAATGPLGVERAIAEKPDLILMDLELPGLDGIDACRAILQKSTMAHTPIIAYTAWHPHLFKRNAIDAGMVGYMQKPATMELLKRMIDQFISKQN
jgi:two-component system cell cycle response regulator DivK